MKQYKRYLFFLNNYNLFNKVTLQNKLTMI